MRVVALGDSITAGFGDPIPGGGWRGWAALLAAALAPPGAVHFHNLAHSGALTNDVADRQLPVAQRLRPDVATVVVGINDTLRAGFDADLVGERLDRIVRLLAAAGTVVLTARLPDPSAYRRRSPGRSAGGSTRSTRQPTSSPPATAPCTSTRRLIRRRTTVACGASTACIPASAAIGCSPAVTPTCSARAGCRCTGDPTRSRKTRNRPAVPSCGGWLRKAPDGCCAAPPTWCPPCSGWP